MNRRSVRPAWIATVVAATGLALLAPLVTRTVPAAQAAAAPLATGGITLHVQSARSAPGIVQGEAITTYKWLIASEAVGDPNDARAHCLPNTPLATDGAATDPSGTSTGGTLDPTKGDNCQWPSIRYTPGAVPVVAQGDQTSLDDNTALNKLPVGKYLISVTANGYKIDGAHFTVDGGTQKVTVEMQPYPLPLGTIRIRVFNDSLPVDATYEVGAEKGIPGFHAILADVLGTVSTDYFGNRLCTTYQHTAAGRMVLDGNGKPVVAQSPGACTSDANGDIVIPNLGPDRYAAQVIAPTGASWVQTTTLEGWHDHDIWVQEGETGYDTEQTVGGEKVPFVDFGFVAPTALPAPTAATGEIKGTAVEINTYVGGTGGVGVPNAGVAGASVRGPVNKPWISLSDLDHNDQMVYTGQGNADGSFDVAGVPTGNYQLTMWDTDQSLILDSFNVTVNKSGDVVNVGQKGLVDWFSSIRGSVYLDANGNGKRDAGEVGVPKFTVALKERDNSMMDQGTNTVTTDDKGNYDIRQAYPLTRFVVLEAFNTRYRTTGITVQADNEKTPRTLLGSAVDVSVNAIIGLSGRVDWGVMPYDSTAGENGGIVGTVTYDTTRNELDPKYAATETYQPGIPGIGVHLYLPQLDAAGKAITDPTTGAVLPVLDAAGSPIDVADTITSETWQQPKGCVPRTYSGAELSLGSAQDAIPYGPGKTCVEAPMLGWQAQPSDTTAGNFGQTVNGNYGFSTSDINLDPTARGANGNPVPLYARLADFGLDPQPLPNRKFLVRLDIPSNPVGGTPMYQVTKEEDVNVFAGDSFLPQENFPADPATPAANPPDPVPTTGAPSQGAGDWEDCAGPNHTVHVTDSSFAAGGGSPFEGQSRPLCDSRLVTVKAGEAAAPNFNLFTPVPLPTHFWGLTINDLGLSNDKTQSGYGEAQPLPGVPMGIYDFTGRLVDTVTTDHNGMYAALEPSTSTYNCPLPAGPCPGMYRFVGNDPGQPGHVNANYNPRFRTIATNFQAWPGLYTVTDTAPTQVAAVASAPGSTQVNPVSCDLASSTTAATPQIFHVDRPYVTTSSRTITVTGAGFGSRGTGSAVTLAPQSGTGPAAPVTIGPWSDTSITFTVGTAARGPYAMSVKSSNGQSTVNGLTIHVLTTGKVGSSTDPILRQVNPPTAFSTVGAGNTTTVQAALEAAATGAGQDLVVVFPGTPAQDNPTGAYFENVVVHSAVRLQGVGPGGFDSAGKYVAGSTLNGLGFNPDNAAGLAWFTLVNGITHAGPANVPDAAVVTVLARAGDLNSTFRTSIDGFDVTGGGQSDFVTNINDVSGGTKTPAGAPGALITQGGGIYVHGGTDSLRITNNVINGNSGSYAGGVRVGTPYDPTGANPNLTISHNRITNNGGTNLAGGIGLFGGTTSYSVDHNDICGNFSAEYGGGISHYGLSTGGKIASNRIYRNQSYDEGGGVMVAGELPSDVTKPSTGSGSVTLDANLVQDNLANDDGGGVRFLQAGTAAITVTNNMVVNNISTHEGGGFALDDATNVSIVGNTVMKNITTATAITSNGQPAPAGLSTANNSDQLQATLPSTAPTFSKPVLRNNIFRENVAGTWSPATGTVKGIGVAGDLTALNYWDMGSVDAGVILEPTYSVLQTPIAGLGNKVADPLVKGTYGTSVQILTSRTFPSYRQAVIVATMVPPTLMGDYHLSATGSPASNAGNTRGNQFDYDGDTRSLTKPDIGADEIP